MPNMLGGLGLCQTWLGLSSSSRGPGHSCLGLGLAPCPAPPAAATTYSVLGGGQPSSQLPCSAAPKAEPDPLSICGGQRQGSHKPQA